MNFLQADLFKEFSEEDEVLKTMKGADRWIAIHACRELSNRILQLFEKWAKPGSQLLLIPCCLVSRKLMTKKLGRETWKKYRDEAKSFVHKRGQRGAALFIPLAIEMMRNFELSSSPLFIRQEVLGNMHSRFNTALFYEKPIDINPVVAPHGAL